MTEGEKVTQIYLNFNNKNTVQTRNMSVKERNKQRMKESKEEESKEEK